MLYKRQPQLYFIVNTVIQQSILILIKISNLNININLNINLKLCVHTGTYCSLGMTRTPDLLRDPCIPGYYCPVKTTYPVPCPGGTYSAVAGRSFLSDCTVTPGVRTLYVRYVLHYSCLIFYTTKYNIIG